MLMEICIAICDTQQWTIHLICPSLDTKVKYIVHGINVYNLLNQRYIYWFLEQAMWYVGQKWCLSFFKQFMELKK